MGVSDGSMVALAGVYPATAVAAEPIIELLGDEGGDWSTPVGGADPAAGVKFWSAGKETQTITTKPNARTMAVPASTSAPMCKGGNVRPGGFKRGLRALRARS